MESTVKSPVMLYTEQTPNPESLKFVTNRMLYHGTADFKDKESAQQWSPLAEALYELPYVRGVYINNNFVTVTKEINYNWEDIMLRIKDFIKKYVESEAVIIREGYAEAMEQQAKTEQETAYEGDEAELVKKIVNIIDTYVKPAVGLDGGNIEFKKYENGVVYVLMQGSCSGCPSSTLTLKAGIEGMLKRMVPQVTEVVQEMG